MSCATGSVTEGSNERGVTGGDRGAFDNGVCSASIGDIGDAAHQMNPARPRIAPVKPQTRKEGRRRRRFTTNLSRQHTPEARLRDSLDPKKGFWAPFSFLLFAPPPSTCRGQARDGEIKSPSKKVIQEKEEKLRGWRQVPSLHYSPYNNSSLFSDFPHAENHI